MTSFSSFLRHPLPVPLVDVRGYGDNRIKRIVDPVGLSEPILDEGGQVFLVPDQFVVVAELRTTGVLFE